MTIPEAIYVFNAITDIVTESVGTYYCGTNTETTFGADANNSPCVMGTIFTVTLFSLTPLPCTWGNSTLVNFHTHLYH